MRDLDWSPKYNMLAGLKDSYTNDFKLKKVRTYIVRVGTSFIHTYRVATVHHSFIHIHILIHIQCLMNCVSKYYYFPD